MIKIFATEKVKEIDKYTIQNLPIEPIALVEEAVTAFVNEFKSQYSKARRVIVFAGQGNNGADALGIARQLLYESYKVETYLFNPTDSLSPECAENKRQLLSIENAKFTEIRGGNNFAPPILTSRDVVIDGLFGSGLNRPLEGGFVGLVKYINASPAEVVAVDIPSGLFGEDNRENDPTCIIQAKQTYTFNFPKLSFFMPENEKYVGEWKILPLNMHPQAIADTPASYFLLTEEDITGVFVPRKRFTHKGTYGHALLVAGSRGKMGAAQLAAKACLRSGAGLLTVHVPKCGEEILQIALPEAMVEADTHDDVFTQAPDVTGYAAVGIGPGLGQQIETAVALDELLASIAEPVVLDADALNLIAANPDLLEKVPERSILTPHPKEFDRLAGASFSAYERLQRARQYAKEHSVCVVLKDAYTAICTMEGNVYVNVGGNPGMATAGSGDVLTGIILGLLAQGYDPETAAVVGVFLHATAGDIAAKHWSEWGMISGDIVDCLGSAFKQVI